MKHLLSTKKWLEAAVPLHGIRQKIQISCEDKEVVEQVMAKLEKESGNMAVTRGKVHTYCSIDLVCTESNEVKVDMKIYLKDVIKKFPGGKKNKKFNSLKLNEKQKATVHGLFAKAREVDSIYKKSLIF